MTLPAQDIVDRLREADANSQQRTLGSRIFGEAADTISRLTADNEALRKQVGVKHDECNRYVNEMIDAKARADALAQKVERMREALTPSADTKAAYWGEFYMGVTLRAGREEEYRRVQIPWDSIKEIMAAISARAALGDRP